MRVAFHPVDGPTYDILATPETAISPASCKIDRNISWRDNCRPLTPLSLSLSVHPSIYLSLSLSLSPSLRNRTITATLVRITRLDNVQFSSGWIASCISRRRRRLIVINRPVSFYFRVSLCDHANCGNDRSIRPAFDAREFIVPCTTYRFLCADIFLFVEEIKG